MSIGGHCPLTIRSLPDSAFSLLRPILATGVRQYDLSATTVTLVQTLVQTKYLVIHSLNFVRICT